MDERGERGVLRVKLAERIAYLEAIVPKMRKLGVLSFGSVHLGPEPTEPGERRSFSEAEKRERILVAQARQRDVMFAASRVRPTIDPGENQ